MILNKLLLLPQTENYINTTYFTNDMKTTNNFAYYENLYHNSYGDAYDVPISRIKKINLLLAIVIVGLYPLPVAIGINKLLPKKLKIRYEVKRK